MNRYFFTAIFFLIMAQPLGAHEDSFKKQYAENFIKHYEFSPEGRYVHEYHPFLLGKTAESFDQLEDELKKQGFNLSGRCVILGYEENAVPPYYTNYKEAKINDEASLKSNAGWSLKLHNRFGFMTGFLFKDIKQLPSYSTSIFEHINSDSVFLFNDRAIIFQEHAFDEALQLIWKAMPCVMQSVAKEDTQQLFKWLIRFWEVLYSGGFKVGNKQIAGTQDILFSIENAKHLLRSNLPVLKYGIGPDITYPIEIFNKQAKEATRNAQSFVKSFVKKLEPINNEPTVYIFCSFVDGVGKSTMLGNIKNWMTYKDDVERFQHVDNSSSQLAEMFTFKDNVFIADLPAQLSHFTYKPDGRVYVDVQTEYKEHEIRELRTFVQMYAHSFVQKYDDALQKVSAIITENGFFDKRITDTDNPAYFFIKNVLLLKKEYDNRWIPFVHNGNHYLFNKTNHLDIRFLTTLGKVKSEGLKNIESEQMLFTDGVRFPLPYQYFLDDLTGKLAKEQVKNVVFVDFLSMYPRSSRENVRINYLLQQLALLDPKFDVKESIYKDFVSGGELLNHLLDRRKVQNVLHAFKLESLVRTILCKSIVDRKEGDLTGFSVEELTHDLSKKIKRLPESFVNYVHSMVVDKIVKERNYFENLYGLSKSFVNIQQFDFFRVCKFTELMHKFFTEFVENSYLQFLWEDPGFLTKVPDLKKKKSDPFVMTTEGMLARLCYTFSSQCRDELMLAPFLRTMRSSWYATLANMVFSVSHSGKLKISRQIYPSPSLFVTRGVNKEDIHVFQKAFEPWKGKVTSLMKKKDSFFHLSNKGVYGSLGQLLYRVNWDPQETSNGIYSFSCNLNAKGDSQKNMNVLSRFVKKYQGEHDVSRVISTTELYEKLKNSTYWKAEYKKILKSAKKNGKIKLDENKIFYFERKPGSKASSKKTSRSYRSSKKKKKKIYWGRDEQRDGVRLWIRMIATLEMIAKDPDSPVAVRFGNKKDFKAAIRFLEKIVLPKYFNIVFRKELFSNYDDVEPYPSWNYWDV